jgi:hypothetical protein
MGDLQIGRVGLGVDLNAPGGISEGSNGRSRTLTIRGHIKETATLEEANHLRRQLENQVQSNRQTGIVPVVSVDDPELDGFYHLTSATLQGTHEQGSYIGTGFFPYTASLQQISDPVFSSGVTGGVLPNDHSTASGDPFIAPPRLAFHFQPDGTEFTRAAADGDLILFRGVDESDSIFWGVSPANYYLNAATIRSGTGFWPVSGYEIPNDPTQFQLENGLIRVEGIAAGEFTIAVHNGTVWESNLDFKLQAAAADVGAWDQIVVLRNDPEMAAVRLFQNRTGTSRGLQTCDISLRRGARHASFFFTNSVSANLKVMRAATDAGTTVSPWGMRDSANDGDGNRWVLGSLSTTTKDTTNGGIERASQTTFDFFAGYELGGSGAASGDAAADLYLQYIHHLSERVVPVVPQGVLL